MESIIWKGLEFCAEQRGAEWRLTEKQTGCYVGKGLSREKTISDSLEKLEKRGIREVKRVIADTLRRAKSQKELLSQEVANRFKAYFGVSIRQFIEPLIGAGSLYFDIIRFDKWLRVPDNVSMKSYLAQEYSVGASKFIESINKL